MIIKQQEDYYDNLSRSVGIAISTAFAGISTGLAIAPLTKINKLSPDYARLDLKNIFSNISLIMLNLMRYYFLNSLPLSPSVVMAGIPMPSVEEISNAMSDRILKYRATGGIFLAHQEGGEQTLRIVGKAYGKNRFIFLTMLDFLFLYGSAKVVDLFATAPNLTGLSAPSAEYLSPSLSADPWVEIRKLDLDEGREEQHLTFPVITQTKVYTSMYIETYDFTESLENGRNCVTYSIFLRKYLPIFPYKYSAMKNEFNNEYAWYYSQDKDDELISDLRTIDLTMEIGFSIAMVMYRFFQHLAGNSIETSIAYISGIALNNQNLGITNISNSLSAIYTDIDYNLTELSTSQKEELMQVE